MEQRGFQNDELFLDKNLRKRFSIAILHQFRCKSLNCKCQLICMRSILQLLQVFNTYSSQGNVISFTCKIGNHSHNTIILCLCLMAFTSKSDNSSFIQPALYDPNK